MTRKRIADALSVLIAAFLFYLGLSYFIDPHGIVTGFGLPESTWPTTEATAFMNIKGVRDFATGVIVVTLLFNRQPRALGWALVAGSLVPVGDATIVLAYGGSPIVALTVHFAAAVVVALGGLLQLRVAKASATAPTTVATA